MFRCVLQSFPKTGGALSLSSLDISVYGEGCFLQCQVSTYLTFLGAVTELVSRPSLRSWA